MGAWGAGSFENDDALDWVGELEDDGVKAIRAPLKAVAGADGDDYVEAPDCSCALAAAEVVAALRGSPGEGLPEECAAWLQANRKPPAADLVDLAKRAVTRVRTSSELKDLWDAPLDGASTKEWYRSVDDLLRRLG